ncbi:MAG: GDCCVxC domain-containing (seleno)protein, partial [Bacteroidota bacterium]
MKNIYFLLIILFLSCGEEKKKENNTTPEKETALNSDITCPHCGFTRNEPLPTEQCLLKYTCTQCKTDIFPKDDDCCVFCSYGTVKCPS